MDRDVLYAKQRYQNYFAKIVAISQAAAPPGKNAANGWMREWMVSDSEIRTLGGPSTLPLSGDGAKLFECYQFSYSVMQRAFVENGNKWSSGFESGSVFWANIGNAVGSIVGIVSAIIQLLSGDDAAKDRAKENLARSIEQLVKDVNNRGTVWNGSHMNGWISVYMKSAGEWSIQQQLDPKFPDHNTEAGRIAHIIRTTFQKIAALETQGHDPWLRAEWQIQFQAILSAAVTTLDSYQ